MKQTQELILMNWIDSGSVRYLSRTPERIAIALKRIGTELKFGQLWTELNWTLHTIEKTGGRAELSAGEL